MRPIIAVFIATAMLVSAGVAARTRSPARATATSTARNSRPA